MRALLAVVATGALIITLSAPTVVKADHHVETITGQVVDAMCFMKDKENNTGVDHKMPADVKDCAKICASNGVPMALVSSDGNVYTITGDLAADNNAKVVPHIGHTVEITGAVSEEDGKMTISAADIKHVSA